MNHNAECGVRSAECVRLQLRIPQSAFRDFLEVGG